MAAMLNGAGALAFAARLFGREVAEIEREAAEGYRGPGETIFLPYLSGERTPHDDPRARGVFFGLSQTASRVDLTRAVMEGVAFTLAEARECLEGAGDSIGRVGLIGGGASSALWTRMIAAALNREVDALPRRRDLGGDRRRAAGAARRDRRAARVGLPGPADYRRRRAGPRAGGGLRRRPRALRQPLSRAEAGVLQGRRRSRARLTRSPGRIQR